MKKIIGSVAALSVLALGSYYGTGMVTERTLKKNLEVIDQSSGLSVHVNQYDRGLFSSKVKLAWQLQIPERFVKNQTGDTTLIPSKTYHFDMPITIYHGPVIFAGKALHFGLGYANSQVSLPEAYVSQFAHDYTEDSILPKLNLTFFVSYLNKTSLHIDVPEFHLVNKSDQSKLEWMGLSSENTLSSSRGELEGEVVVKGVRLTQDKHVSVLDKVNSTYDLHRSAEGLYLGDIAVHVPLLTVTQNEQIELEMKSLQANSSSDIREGLFDSTVHASFEKIFSHDKTYGPGRISFSIKNIDAPTLVTINQKMNEIQRGTDAERNQAALAVLPELPKLLGQGAALEISELNVIVPEGTVVGSLRITLPKGDAGNPFQLVQKIEGEGKLKVPSALLNLIFVQAEKQKLLSQPAQVVGAAAVETTPSTSATPEVSTAVVEANVDDQAKSETEKRIAQLVKTGAIVSVGQDYAIEVKLSSGEFSINGHSLTAEMFQY